MLMINPSLPILQYLWSFLRSGESQLDSQRHQIQRQATQPLRNDFRHVQVLVPIRQL